MALVLLLPLLAWPGPEMPGVPGPARPITLAAESHQKALALYTHGLLFERGSDLLAALKALEEARKLDPRSAPVLKALTRLYLALDRGDEALAAGAQALELAPGDVETAYLHARQLRSLHRFADAAAVLAKVLDRIGPKEQPELRTRLALDLATAREELNDPKGTEGALRVALAALDQRGAILAGGKIPERELTEMTAETWERLAKVCALRNQTEDALAGFARAGKLDPERAARLAFQVARLYEKQGNPAKALAAVGEYLRARPADVAGYELKIRLLRTLNRASECVPLLEAASQRNPASSGLTVLLGKEYIRAGRSQDAETLYRRALQATPNTDIATALIEGFRADASGDRTLLLLDALLTSAAGTPADKDNPLRQEIAPDPVSAAQARALLVALRRNPEATTALLKAAAGRLLARGTLHRYTRQMLATLAARTHQLQLAETLYRSCLRNLNASRFPPGNSSEPDLYIGLLRVLALANKNQEIVDLCRAGLANSQETLHALFHDFAARALMALGKGKESLAEADEAVKVAPPDNLLYYRRNRALLRAEAGKVPEAVAECHALLKEYNRPEDASEIREALSTIWSLGGNLAKSKEQLQLILESDPTNATACNDLGFHYAEQNRKLDEAERLVRKALELDRKQRASGLAVGVDSDQDNPAYVDSLGWVLFRQGHLAAARKQLEHATELADGANDPTIWDHLGDVLARLDDRPAARAAYQRALQMYASGQRRRPEEAPAEIQKKLRLLQPR